MNNWIKIYKDVAFPCFSIKVPQVFETCPSKRLCHNSCATRPNSRFSWPWFPTPVGFGRWQSLTFSAVGQEWRLKEKGKFQTAGSGTFKILWGFKMNHVMTSWHDMSSVIIPKPCYLNDSSVGSHCSWMEASAFWWISPTLSLAQHDERPLVPTCANSGAMMHLCPLRLCRTCW